MIMTPEDFISHFPACPVCKTPVVAIQPNDTALNYRLASCSRQCLSLSFNGKFVFFEPEDHIMRYDLDTNELEVGQSDFPYEKDLLGKYPFKKMQEKVLTYVPPSRVYSVLGKYFESGL